MVLMLMFLSVSVLLAGLAVYMALKSRKQAAMERVLERLGQPEQDTQPSQSAVWGYVQRLLIRAGIALPPERLKVVIVSWVCVLLLVLLIAGLPMMLLLAFGSLAVFRALLSLRVRRRLRRMGQQLAPMLDQVIRGLQTGRTLSDSVLVACQQSQEPLRNALQPVVRNVQLGVPLAEAMQDVAELYEQDELQIMALGLRVNERYGGSAVDLFSSLVVLIHERDQAARQLRAMTGETRVTAVVLAILPAAVAGYMMVINPRYITSMWLDESGRWMLISAFVLQALGCLMLWRMLRSV